MANPAAYAYLLTTELWPRADGCPNGLARKLRYKEEDNSIEWG